MSLAPSESPPPESPPPAGPPAEASRPLLPPSPPLTQVVENGSAPPLPQTAAPFASPPSPPTPRVVVLPPANSVPPPVASTPQPKVSPVASPLPPATIPSFLPPAASPLPPLVEAPPPTGLPPVEAPPPKDPFTPIAPVVPLSSPLPPEPPIPPVTSPPFSTRSLPPKSPPQPPSQIPPLEPKTSFPPLPTPLRPEVVSPPPLTTPFAQEAAPPALTTPSTVLFPPTRPSYPPEFALQPPATPELPTSTVLSPPLSLPLVGETLPATSKQSHLPIGLIVVCAVGGIFLLALLGLLCICYRHRKNHATKDHKPSFPTSKDDAKTMVAQHSQQNFAVLPGEHVITVQPEAFPLPLPTRSKVSGSCSSDLRPENQQQHQSPYVDVSLSTGTITYEELLMATNGFSEAHLLGQGGFGFVHKGVLRGGKEVAVKKLREGSRQGEREFQTEVEIIGRVHHKHLVSLIGYCITGAERLLVYEFVPNNTLEFHLHGKGQPVMEWATRLKIAIRSAKGLAYLHEDCYPKIIHRDIKAANILLDHNFEPKVSDFGLAKSFPDATGSITHISTQVVGTFGYLAPEYASSGKVTDKSDVYSYGVMLLELITGRPPIKDTESEMRKGLVDWARPLLSQALEDDNFEALVDPRLETDYDRSEMASMVSCAAACVRHSAWLRPRMSQIVHALEGNISAKALNEGTKPGHTSNYDSNEYQEDMMRHKVALSAQPQGISECSGTTTEYGFNPSSSSSDGCSR